MKRIILVGAAALILLIALGATLAVAAGPETTPLDDPPPETTIAINPVARLLSPYEHVTVTIDIGNAQHLFAIDLRIRFDPEVVIVTDANEAKNGIQILPGTWFAPVQPIGHMNSADNAEGLISYTAMLETPDEPPPHGISGSGAVATITFQGLGLGVTDVTIESATLLPGIRDADPIPVDILHGCRISVAPPLTEVTYLPLGLRNAP